MKPRHAAALALVGWYLMMPSGDPLDPAPIAQWGHMDSYDTAKECDDGRQTFINTICQKSNEKDCFRAQGCECIETDDPRLKPN